VAHTDRLESFAAQSSLSAILPVSTYAADAEFLKRSWNQWDRLSDHAIRKQHDLSREPVDQQNHGLISLPHSWLATFLAVQKPQTRQAVDSGWASSPGYKKGRSSRSLYLGLLKLEFESPLIRGFVAGLAETGRPTG
jgi:hypothetical protein